MKKLIFSTMTCLFISGCAFQIAPSENNQSVENLVVKLPPEKTYQNLVRAAREKCFPMTIDAQFYQSTQEGDVTLATNFDASMKVIWAIFALAPIGPDTSVTIRSPGRIKEFFGPATKWMNGLDAPCPVDKR